jgi:catecholate siderophore receptor
MRRTLLRAAALAVALFSLVPVTTSAQSDSESGSSGAVIDIETAAFSFRGVVLDPSRAPIAGALVSAIVNPRTAALSTVTNPRGEFSLSVPVEDFTLVIRSEGFAEVSQRVRAQDASTPPAEFVLQLSGVVEQVEVSGGGGYEVDWVSSATRTATALRDVPQSVTVVTQELMKDQLMQSVGDAVRYVPGISAHQGENNRDDVVIRGNRSSADFFVNGVRDDVQYYRDLYNLERIEALKGPNAMIFGRGGGGGVLNRVVKEPLFRPLRAVAVELGGYDHKRAATDLNARLGSDTAVRLNGMFERSGSFRNGVDLERSGVNPTLTWAPHAGTKLTVGYEYLRDTRVADRGITSFQGKPADVDLSTFYGDPEQSDVKARVNIGSVALEQAIGTAVLRNRTVMAGYDRFYQNFVPGAASADQQTVALTAYNNATDRTNLFNQTDLTYVAHTGSVRHTLLAGAEVGRQLTDNFRNTGYFNNTATSISVPFHDPAISTPVTFRQSATDADNHVRTNVAAAFVQDQIALSSQLQLLGGLRFDRFDLKYHNNRTGEELQRVDNLLSPRAGVVYKPVAPVSVYGSYSVSYLPSSGDQFSSLTTVTQQVKPERFNNYEVGAKWDVGRALSFTTAVYRLDRTNTRSTDPNDPTRIVQTGSQRTNGFEAGVNGQVTSRWKMAGGYAFQDAFVTSATSAAPEGAIVGQVPRHTFSLWNNYQVHPRVAGGIGLIHRSDMFATISDTVTLPGYVRADAAAYFTLTKDLRLQVNLENTFDKRYFVNADSNTNISPGTPQTLRVALTAGF